MYFLLVEGSRARHINTGSFLFHRHEWFISCTFAIRNNKKPTAYKGGCQSSTRPSGGMPLPFIRSQPSIRCVNIYGVFMEEIC